MVASTLAGLAGCSVEPVGDDGAADATGGTSTGLPGTGGAATATGGSGGASLGGAPGTGGVSTGTGGVTEPVEPGPATVWLAGDSTVANGPTPCPTGWGKAFDALFDERITVVNSAVGGRSVRTWLYDVQGTKGADGECLLAMDGSGQRVLQARWTDMLAGMKAGDFLFIQFGINDGDANCPRHVGTTALAESYLMMANAAKSRGAQPIFVTPVSAIACNGSTPKGTRGFVQTVIDLGAAQSIPVIDLHARSIALYAAKGFCPVPGGDVSAATGGPVGEFFCDDHTHFSASGAVAIGELVADGLRDSGSELAEYLK
ncbi:MAG TPA: GDSL-type esterase/lipase family protein [Polyangiaceae bacterium]|nr:GDSL-type esterase/lipase family protein [Polyangiaceae bacterium]